MKKYLRLLAVSACFVGIVALGGIVFGFATQRSLIWRYAFTANFFIGAVVILSGIVAMLVPSSMVTKGSKLFDRSTFVQRSFDAREQRQHRAREVLWVGIFNILIAGIVEVFLSLFA